MENRNEPRKEAAQNPSGTPANDPKPPGKRFPWKIIIGLVVLAVVIAVVIATRGRGKVSSQGQSAGGPRGALGPVSVIIGTVTQEDVPIYLDGLGTVQAFNLVTVRSRVDGQLQKLAFREG